MPLVTFNIDPNADPAPSPSNTGCSSGTATLATSHSGSDDGCQQHKWKEGRAERIKSLEAVLGTCQRRQLKAQQQGEAEANYDQMLASEGEDGDEDRDEDEDKGDSGHDSGRQQHTSRRAHPGTAAHKTADQYLAWDTRLRRAVGSLCFSCTASQGSSDTNA
ncbi:hypothetical protein DL89DRAFT_294475 [Linderina pennispora]|uniref:Uncharacterized protein n=1 Tax=Linderina pennispora TaxID=61395 RepID=A0A1Y1W312_9FUNG|nr:uncharacterized protein DL89DRAFT_294475 [Linderina pennispora]ORX67943.1 hypothetical protein DL89DRAFT_294475 [Linderina pennispora]